MSDIKLFRIVTGAVDELTMFEKDLEAHLINGGPNGQPAIPSR